MNSKKLRVLLVEDEQMLQGIYSVNFNKTGHQFLGLDNAEGDFMKKVTDFNPDIILMDIDLKAPIDGVTAAEKLQLEEQTKGVPIVFFTNADMPKLVERAKKLSSSLGFLIKSNYVPSEAVSLVEGLYAQFLRKRVGPMGGLGK